MKISHKMMLGLGLAFAFQPSLWLMAADEAKVDKEEPGLQNADQRRKVPAEKTAAFERAAKHREQSLRGNYRRSKDVFEHDNRIRDIKNEIKLTPDKIESLDGAAQVSRTAIAVAELYIERAYETAQQKQAEIEKEKQNLDDYESKKALLQEQIKKLQRELPGLQEARELTAKRSKLKPVEFDKSFVVLQTIKDGKGETTQSWHTCNLPVTEVKQTLEECYLPQRHAFIEGSDNLVRGEYEQNEAKLEAQMNNLRAKHKAFTVLQAEQPTLQVVEEYEPAKQPEEVASGSVEQHEQELYDASKKDIPTKDAAEQPAPAQSRIWNLVRFH